MTSTRRYDSRLRREQAEETRRRILRALCDLLIEERPASVSIPAVARRAGVSVRSVYHHFPSKEDLYDALGPFIRDEVVGQEAPDADVMAGATGVVSLMREYVPPLARAAPLFTALVRAGIDDDELASTRRNERLALLRAKLSEELPGVDHDDIERLAVLLAGLASWATVQRMTTAGRDVEDVAELVAWSTEVLIDRARRSGRVGSSRPTADP